MKTLQKPELLIIGQDFLKKIVYKVKYRSSN